LALAEIGDFAVSVALGDAIVCLSRTIILRVHLERCSTPADLEFIGLVSSLEALQGLKAVVGAEALVELLLGSALIDTGAIGRARVSPAARSVGVASGGGGAREASRSLGSAKVSVPVAGLQVASILALCNEASVNLGHALLAPLAVGVLFSAHKRICGTGLGGLCGSAVLLRATSQLAAGHLGQQNTAIGNRHQRKALGNAVAGAATSDGRAIVNHALEASAALCVLAAGKNGLLTVGIARCTLLSNVAIDNVVVKGLVIRGERKGSDDRCAAVRITRGSLEEELAREVNGPLARWRA
jgi:hypothetical protein